MNKKKKVPSSLMTDTAMLNKAFVLLSFVCMLFSIVIAMASRGDSLKDVLFWNGSYTDHFMDFFNTLRDSHDLTWVYQRSTIYPPLSVLIMYMFASIVPHELAALPFADRYVFQQSQIGVLLFFILCAVCILILAKMIDSYMEHTGIDRTRYLVVFFVIISFPILYCTERGNTSLIAMLGSAFFMFFRNSENKVIRELSYIALAFAAGLKMFPAVLGVLLLYDRKYAAAGRTIVYGILAFAIPFVLVKWITPETGLADQVMQEISAGNMDANIDTDGSILRLVKNLFKWSNKKTYFTFNSTSIANIFYLLNKLELLKKSAASALGMIAFVGTELAAFVMGFFCKKDWQKMFCACYLMLNIHAIAMHYTLIYVIPIFIVFLCENKKRSKADWLYFSLFSLQIVPIPYILYGIKDVIKSFISVNYQLTVTNNINKTFSGFAFQLIFIVIFLELFVGLIKNRTSAKKKKAEKSDSVA